MSLTKAEHLIRRQMLAKLTLRIGADIRRHEECPHFNPVLPPIPGRPPLTPRPQDRTEARP